MNLEEIFELIKSYSPEIEDVYLSGSRVLPWIENPHDYDIVVYTSVPWEVDAKSALRAWFREQKAEKEIENIYSIVSIVPPIHDPLKVWMYEQHFYGNHKPQIDILTTHRKNYIKGLTYYRDHTIVDGKWLYHVLTGIYILKRNAYELSQEEIDNINLIHDKQATQEQYQQLKAWAMNQITELEKELN